MAAQITAAVLMLLLTWFAGHRLIRTDKVWVKVVFGIVAIVAFLSWSGNALGGLGIVPWGIGSVILIIAIGWEASHARKK